jgi:hypothetical protein
LAAAGQEMTMDKMLRWCGCLAVLWAVGHVPAVSAATTYSGFLDDQANLALVGSDLGAPEFGDDFEIANNVAVYSFSLAAPGNVTFDSNGFAAGGVDPYFTLFAGGDDGATVLASNYDQAFSTGGDFLIALALAAGDYRFALGAFANMSVAENSGFGTYGDGFTFLGGPDFLGNSYYELVVDTGLTPVPEPSTAWLMTLALLGLTVARCGHARHPGRYGTWTRDLQA